MLRLFSFYKMIKFSYYFVDGGLKYFVKKDFEDVIWKGKGVLINQ